ncbi:MAG: hypothetical protein M3461_15045 [Pseudomonadota bacterium]|nr:hypothetical protein [Pseudomonadota bacterium]
MTGTGLASLRTTPSSWTFKPCWGHKGIATAQVYTHAGQERLSKLVADTWRFRKILMWLPPAKAAIEFEGEVECNIMKLLQLIILIKLAYFSIMAEVADDPRFI